MSTAAPPIATTHAPRPGLDAPVFILGCPRSGTTLLYHMLVSSGHFVNYRAEVHAFSVLGPKFGQFRRRHDRDLFLRQWLPTNYCAKTGLDRDLLRDTILKTCSSPADFLAGVMQLMAERQNVHRWAECTPANVFHLPQIHSAFPKARFVHMVRDGRDVALSLARQKWISPLPWDKTRELSVAALFWQRNVKIGTRDGESLGDQYREVRFEDLVERPAEVLTQLSEFIDEDLDYGSILENPVGSVSRPNTSFGGNKSNFSPVGRWHEGMTDEQLSNVEALIGNMLLSKGYELSEHRGAPPPARLNLMRATYKTIWSLKHWFRTQTFLGRFSDMGLIRSAAPQSTS